MRTRSITLVALAAVLAAWPAPAAAQRATISLSPKLVTFPLLDPDTAPVLISTPIQIDYRILGGGQDFTWRLTVLAEGDLIAGNSSVDISNVTWTAAPAPPFQDGTLSRTVAQLMATGSGQVNPVQTASLTFRLTNSWHYKAGTYTQNVVFTLSTP